MAIRQIIVGTALAALGVLYLPPVLLPDAEAGQKSMLLDEHWLASDPDSKVTIEHDDWQAFLDTYLEVAPPYDPSLEVTYANERSNRRIFANYEIHDQREVVGKHQGRKENLSRFDYGAVRAEDRVRLNNYLTRMQAVELSKLNRDEQEAFWINLYNALVTKIVLDNYPIDSILDVDLSDDPLRRGPWTARLVTVEGRELSLDNIAHNILRPIWKDERLIYALSCGALGCPEPIPTVFAADTTDLLLEQAATRFVNHPRGASIREINKRRDSINGDGRLYVSSLYTWYREDFGGKRADINIISHLRDYADDHLLPMLERAGEIDDEGFDWGLNDIED